MFRLVTTRLSAALVLALTLAACGSASGPAPSDLPDRDVFVATYVDLRVTALGTPGGEITDEGRTEVLTRHAVTEDQLVAFVDYHGEDLPFMREVWNEIELLLDAQRPTIDEEPVGND